ncbi:MAG: prevent-host-death protein [Lachnospiraceae bacterium]|jgi:PHD/YefM family antitoxin component YafN of YafNO toxin-antitoxin module|nr:prevent-host-death protein [Lachnospiraceae bacterium]
MKNHSVWLWFLHHKTCEPVFITRNGQGDLAVMNIDAYDELSGRKELYRLLDEGHADVLAGRGRPAKEVFEDIKRRQTEKYGD